MPRYVSIWFPWLMAQHTVRKNSGLRDVPFVLASPRRGRMTIDAVHQPAYDAGIRPDMALADAKAVLPALHVEKTETGLAEKLLRSIAEWSIRFTPSAAVDFPDGVMLDASGCPHLWGGEKPYLENIRQRLNGYTVKIAMADTMGAAWAMARFGHAEITPCGTQYDKLRPLPVEALRLEEAVLSRLRKLGLKTIGSVMDMPKRSLHRRFGPELLKRMGQAMGTEIEMMFPIKPPDPFHERLPCLEPITTAVGIGIALEKLLEKLCVRLENEGMGLRQAIFTAYRIDGNTQAIEIGTCQPSRNGRHIFRLFEDKIATLEPDLGFELFTLDAPQTERVIHEQSAIWSASAQNDKKVAELLDRIQGKAGAGIISRYLPDERHWPEHSIRKASPLWEKPVTEWRTDLPRPVHLLEKPEPIDVMATLPDYPPIHFNYKGKRYPVKKSDGPERIEQEWWLKEGLYRDYYAVEDKRGARYWLFRAGPYEGSPKWFIHGFFA